MKKILVIGAGPVGLTMAAELARHGIRCQIVDKLLTPSTFCRALGVSARTLEVWEDMGIAQEAIESGIWLKGRQIELPGQPGLTIKSDYTDLSYASLGLPQYETERILTKHLENFGITIRRGVSVTDITTDSQGLIVTLANDAGDVTRETFDYVIGCDGAHSVVRRLSKIDFQGEMMPYEFMLADVEIDWDVPRGITYNALHPAKDTAPDFFLAVPLPDPKRYRISTLSGTKVNPDDKGSDHGIQSERPAPGLDAFQQIADRLLTKPAKLSDVRWSSIFRISMRLAAKYRRGNTFIAGDAAHIHPPTGGQGMNTGIQDAYNLAWKLALVCRGLAKDGLLDSYEAERQEEGMNVIKRTVAASMNFGKAGLKPDKLADSQMLVSYRNSPWVKNEGEIDAANPSPLSAGDRAPDCMGLQRYGVGFRFRLFEILKGADHILLVDARSNTKETIDALYQRSLSLEKKFGRGFSSCFRIAVIGQEPEPVTPESGIVYLYDAEKHFPSAYHSTDGAAFIIRPDGYIGWRGMDWKSPGIENWLGNIFK